MFLKVIVIDSIRSKLQAAHLTKGMLSSKT